MLLSMTGHGSSSAENELVHVVAEIRAVNNRFLKISIAGELDAEHQALIEAMVRDRVVRGTINVRLQLQLKQLETQYVVNQAQLKYYRENLHEDLARDGSVLLLPGVVVEKTGDTNMESIWPVVKRAMVEALDHFCQMRAREGQAMLQDLLANCQQLSLLAGKVQQLAPQVADSYAKRITERINRLLEDHNVSVTTADLVREVGIFAERADISEELVRLASHVQQFKSIAGDPQQSDGRKLDFLTQELLRETNTIGSKANDAEIASLVVEMKSVIERIREMAQNIE